MSAVPEISALRLPAATSVSLPDADLEAGLATARRTHGWSFIALAAPVASAPALVAAAKSAPLVAWSSHSLTLVGMGVALELRGAGADRWRDVVTSARKIVVGAQGDDPLVRPRLLGGVAFAPGSADGGPWTGFGDAWFMLPRWTYVHDGTRGALVLAVDARDAQHANRWHAELAALRAVLAAGFVARPQPPLLTLDVGDREAWRAQVQEITDAIARGECAKIVAARTALVTLAADARPADMLAELDSRQTETVRLVVRPPGAGTLIAATPERLVRLDHATVACDALAGSVARGDEDAASLLASGKDRREHELVVSAIASALRDLGAAIDMPSEPSLRTLRHMLHLHTPIAATLREERHLLEIAAALHPTPAVGGTPTRSATDWIAAHETVPRGWYASPVGWFDLDGNGELAVAIRSGVLAGDRAHLWAGAGIVAGSDPDRELAETDLKLRAMLGALGGPDVTTPAVQTLWAELIAATLADAGVGVCVISPGSRSTPLVAALIADGRLELPTIIDERAAAFYALGVARATGIPCALVCTSGSAAAHYMPAFVEASMANVPLIAITADRPAELQHCGASQTIDQVGIYGSFTRAAFDLGAPVGSALALRAVRRTMLQAITAARGPLPGPVHLNVPLRKPLEPAQPSTDDERALAKIVAEIRRTPVTLAVPRLVADRGALAELAAAICEQPRGVIVAGALPASFAAHRDAAFALAARAEYPVLAEAGSQLRYGVRPAVIAMIDHFDLALTSAPLPKLILQLGSDPVAQGWAAAQAALCGATRWVITDGAWRDPDGTARVIAGDLGDTLANLEARIPQREDMTFPAAWRELHGRVSAALDRAIAAHPHSETAVIRAALDALPAGALLQIGNSLPIRVVDHVRGGGNARTVITQRGAAGIDGLIASAAGATRAGQPVLLILGDVSFAHDVGGLLAAREAQGPLAIVVIDNGGGRIFDQLPIAKLAPAAQLQQHWHTPPALDPAAIATAFGLRAVTAAAPAAVGSAIASALATRGPTVIHAPVTATGAQDVRRDALEQLSSSPIRTSVAVTAGAPMSDITWKRHPGYEDIHYETCAEGIAKVTINRPEVHNAFRPRTVAEMIRAFDEARDDSSIGAVILTGAGTEAFCSGGDQRVRGTGGYVGSDGIPRLNVLDLQMRIRYLPKPVIAMVAGYAIGGGHVLHLVCDLTIAAENAKFGQTGPRVGSFDAGFGSSYLARCVGQKKAREIWFLCRQYDAKAALDMGLVNTVVPLAELEATTIQWCREMLALSPMALRMLKLAMNADCDGQAGVMAFAGSATLMYYTTDEGREGKEAFLEKRTPDFSKFPRYP